MRILVTGIDGFVGSHVADFLSGMPNVEIHGAILNPVPGENLDRKIPNLRLHQVDLTQRSRVAEIFHDIRPDRVIHLAGQAFVPTAVQDPVGTIDANVSAGVYLLEAARAVREREGVDASILIVSSGEVYGAVEANRLPVTEDHALHPVNPYAASKGGLDLIAQTYRGTYGMHVVVARPFNHAGPRQSPLFVTSGFARKFAEFTLGLKSPLLDVGNIHVRRDFTDVRDVVKAYWALLDLSAEKDVVYNVCSGVAHEIVEVIEELKLISGIEPQVILNEQKMRAYDVPLLIGSNKRLHEATGWCPEIKFRDTLRDVYMYWKEKLPKEGPR